MTNLKYSTNLEKGPLLSQTDIRRLEAVLRLVVKRNDDMLSAAVRRAKIGENRGQTTILGGLVLSRAAGLARGHAPF